MLFRLTSFTLLVVSCLLSPAMAGTTVTHEVVQLNEQSLVNVELKNETLDFDAATKKTTEETVEEYDEDDEYEEEEEYDDEEEQIAEAHSTTVSSPAVRVAADEVGSDLGEPQVIDSKIGDQVKERIADARIYVQDTVKALPEYEKVREMCYNKHSNCAFWAGKFILSSDAIRTILILVV